MVKSLVSKLSSASSNLSLASTLSSVGVGSSGGGGHGHGSGVQETNYAKHRNDPGRFFGDGVKFKAKLIGILEVGEARGDRMCQEALQDLKMALRAAGEHKQRITIHVTIDGLRLRDEKTSDSLYHHPVHKISFIAQDMTDSRAFGYIFGSPDSGHRFFGIKTDKAASQVVLAMRDLFQVVFELKKKEIELARQQIQSKSIHEHQLASLSSLKSAGAHNDLSGSGATHSLPMLGSGQGTSSIARLGVNLDVKGAAAKEMSPESVADLVDLEQELSSIQRGITQMERITPSEPIPASIAATGGMKTSTEEDPFGDSFTNFPTYNLLPPPESGRSRHKPNKPIEPNSNAPLPTLLSHAPIGSGSPGTLHQQQDDDDSWLNELDQQNDVFDTSKTGVMGLGVGLPMAPLAPSESTSTPTQQLSECSAVAEVELAAATTTTDALSTIPEPSQTASACMAVKSDAFTDLDPLGTGRTRPYVDKKYFFQELKNPPKKVLKDLSSSGGGGGSSASTNGTADASYSAAAAVVDEFLSKEGLFDDATLNAATAATAASATASTARNQPQSLPPLQPQKALNVTNPPNNTTDAVLSAPLSTGDPVLLPRDTDPFSPTRKKSDPFQEGDIFSKLDPFEFEFSGNGGVVNRELDIAQRESPLATTVTATAPVSADVRRVADVFNGPLQVNLPPEPVISPSGGAGGGTQWRSDISSRHSPHTVTGVVMGNGGIGSMVRSRPTPSGGGQQSSSGIGSGSSSVFKQQSAVDVLSSISNKKMPHLFGQARFSKRVGGDSNSINMRRLQESGDSLSENETAPEPPPRPDSASHVEPPPLPPKKQFNDIIIRPRVTSGNAVPLTHNSTTSSRYEFINSVSKTSAAAVVAGDVPPIPLPSRRIGRSDGAYPGPGRPRKPGHTEDDYLTPIDMAANGTAAAAEIPPPLLPPPTQISTRARTQRQQSQQSKAQEIYENKTEILQQQQQHHQTMDDGAATAAIIPDITLSQLLTLSIDELAMKLGVPASKLSTMTLVELTSYLSEFIEKSKTSVIATSMQKTPPQTQTQSLSPVLTNQTSIFRVNFDQQVTFVAKFDDTFGEDLPRNSGFGGSEPFVANFAQFNEPPPTVPAPVLSHDVESSRTTAVPPADRYAVFREIIDQELQQQQEDTDLIGDMNTDDSADMTPLQMESNMVQVTSYSTFEAHFEADDFLSAAPSHEPQMQPPKIDTKITEVVAQAKDRYAALRDIILVENLFEHKSQAQDLMQDEFSEFNEEYQEDQDLKQIMDDRASSAGTGADRIGLVDSRGFPGEPSSSALTVQDDDEDEDGGAESSLDSNEKDAQTSGNELRGLHQDQYEQLSTSTQQLDVNKLERAEGVSPLSFLPGVKQDSKFLTVAGATGLCSSKDDLEIDELMQRAISNLSLDSRERISPANSTNTPGLTGTPSVMGSLAKANGVRSASLTAQGQQFNDVSTSPIPLQKSPVPAQVQKLTPVSSSAKLLQASPILSQLSAVSNLIDAATKQIGTGDLLSESEKPAKESWATFDSPKPEAAEKRARAAKSAKSATLLHLPPPPPSNTSQNDTAESPCSSDPRDDSWVKTGAGGVNAGGKRWAKKERQHTSSSSRDLSPWDDEAPEFQKQKRIPVASQPGKSHAHATDRHGYYMRHARRMNSCDEDYDYDDDFNHRREPRKFKQGISRSRDNFDLDSPSWYHHAPHHSWSPQDIEQATTTRGRSFERSAYERSTYGPPIYDKRGVALPPAVPPSSSSYERRSGYDKRKYYRDRDYTRPNYDFEEYGESPPIYREAGSFEKLKMGRRSDYENIYDDGRSPMGIGSGGGGYKSRTEYMYERDRKSFDRESVESFESASRRRRSFGSGDVYGSIESREDFRDRYMGGAEKTRSLRKSVKLRTTGDIEYEQDSENDFPQQQRSRAVPLDTRSLQRPSQLVAAGVVGGINTVQTRMRKSSGSSPWDGDEPPLTGQKSWKRPSSAADSERRMAESRRAAVFGQTPSGSDGEKDRRYRRKQRSRGKELQSSSNVSGTATSGGRYGNYDYITYDDDNEDDDDDYVDEEYEEPPTDEDKFERLNRRRHEMHQRMLESERRQHGVSKAAPAALKCGAVVAAKKYHAGVRGGDFDYDEYEQTPTPRSNASASGGSGAHTSSGVGASTTKFSFDGGFESDFNQSSPPPAPVGTASSCTSTPAAGTINASTTPATKSSFRFSNDFSEREHRPAFGQNSTSASSLQQFDLDTVPSPASHTTPPITQKLRFDDNVKVSQFDDAAFEDDFSKAKFDFEKEDQWHADALQTSGNNATVAAKKHNLRNSKMQQRQELIKKSESINIFAKKAEDPFEDDEFFKAPGDRKISGSDAAGGSNANAAKNGNSNGNQFQWDDDNNFAKFDENM